MTGQLFISLLNPGIGLLLALAFWFLWLHQREQTYVAVAACSYALSMLGFLVQDVLPPLPYELHRIPSNLLFLLAASGLVIAVVGRYGIKAPVGALAIWITLGMAGHIWFLLVQHDITARIVIVGAALGGIASIMAFKLWGQHRRGMVDRVLFWVSVATATNFVLRPILIVWMAGGYASYDGFQQSLYWSTVQFTQALVSVSFALLLMVAVASDLIDELRQQAAFDKLSGLLNRRGFEEKASAALALCAERKQVAGLLIVDFDHFKSINDSFGHAVGDAVIAVFGDLVRRTMPEGTLAGRIGGEEFALLLPDTDSRTLRNYAEIVRTGIKVIGKEQLPDGVDPSLSIGVYIGTPGAQLHDLMSRADAALYEAKREGRNRVSVAPAELRLIGDVTKDGSGPAFGSAV